MIELWGANSCEACKPALKILQSSPLEFKYVGVENTGFEGELPRLVLEDGVHIVGLGRIHSFVNQKMRELGIL
ncbi:unnamed protein product [marine sediment metagenome]|uniref:Glutaredoxin domain-containing protein n=1 Tax=marine sediment metagenome TaxID=412755 RepID=X1BTQ3_9ZZZZ